MPLTLASFQFKWRALVAFVMLVAFVLPMTAEAACYEAIAPSRSGAQLVVNNEAVTAASTEAPAPAKNPAGNPSHAALCQHGHCGHAQAWPETPVQAAGLPRSGRLPAISPPEDALASWLIDGPERPPQA